MNATIRTRLTVLYGVAFFIAGLVLVTVMYFQINQVIGQQLIVRSVLVGAPEIPPPDPHAPASTTRFELQLPRGGAQPQADKLLAGAQEQMREARAAALKRVMTVSILSLVGVGVFAALLGWLMAGQALQPLRQMMLTVRGIADRNLHQRIAMQGPRDEIKDLADTLDDMLGRLDRAFDSQQRFIANASHELRTPLAINRALVEVAMMKEPRPDSPLNQLGTTLLAVNQRHERLIDGLLMLASSEQQVADPQEVDLAEVAGHVLGESASMARSAGVELRARLDAAPCRGDPVLLERLVQNLVENAIRYNVPAGWLAVTTSMDAEVRATITVENPGSMIPAYEVPRLFEPFRRLASTERLAEGPGSLGRRGAGLGLSIVRAIITSHGGSVQAVPREEGGLLLRVVLPAPRA